MINFYNQVPSVYNSASRDFQYLSWLINVVLNSVKHNVDDLYDLPNTKADSRLTELLAMTLGFKVKRNYNQKQLEALISIIPSILKYKGSKEAVNLACLALIKASGAQGIFKVDLKDNCVEIQLPETLVDTILLRDLLPYILPAGLTTRIVTKTELDTDIDSIEVGYYDVPMAAWRPDLTWDNETGHAAGLATMFMDSTVTPEGTFATPEFSNFKIDGNKVLNTGLLDNSLIPAVDSPVHDVAMENLKKQLAEVEKEEE
jgi:hypothetical protein